MHLSDYEQSEYSPGATECCRVHAFPMPAQPNGSRGVNSSVSGIILDVVWDIDLYHNSTSPGWPEGPEPVLMCGNVPSRLLC